MLGRCCVAIVAAARFSRLTTDGLDAARRWQAYRDGLKAEALGDAPPTIDLDAALPDIVAFGLANTFRPYLESATEPGSPSPLRTLAGTNSGAVQWAVFAAVVVAPTSTASTVSGVGAASGGGAAGST